MSKTSDDFSDFSRHRINCLGFFFDFFRKRRKFGNVQKIVQGLFIAGIEPGLMRCDHCCDVSSTISKKVMGDDTSFEVRKVVSWLLMNGFRSGLMNGARCS